MEGEHSSPRDVERQHRIDEEQEELAKLGERIRELDSANDAESGKAREAAAAEEGGEPEAADSTDEANADDAGG